MTKTLTLTAIAALVAASFATQASAGLSIESRDSWAPGYTFDDGRYVRFIHTDDNAAAGSIRREVRTAWAPGFNFEDGQYVRESFQPGGSAFAGTTLQREVSIAWAPGFHHEDGQYVRYSLGMADTGTALAALPEGSGSPR